MSKRPALGVLTNKSSASSTITGSNVSRFINPSKNGPLLKANTITATVSAFDQATNVFKTANNNLALDQFQFNDENEPPSFVLTSFQQQQQQSKAKQQQPIDLDFEIFQEDAKQTAHFLPPEKCESDEDQEDENDDEYEDDDEDDNLADNKENDEVLEEEGISRLNLAVMSTEISTATTLSSKLINTSSSSTNSGELMMVMDSSGSIHNDSSSPMVLDDTIKFLSKIETDDDEEEDDNDGVVDNNVDDDEETRQKFEIQERENILMNCLEYKDEIVGYMRELEKENRPKANYMKKQADITSSMRSILIDWLVEVCDEYKLTVETLYLAVNYADRFLSQMSVLRGKLQLVGTAAMYIAAKYEEITPPDVSEFVYITDDTYTKKQVLRMEHLMLKVLDFRMSQPTANWFLSHYLRFLKIQTNLGHSNNIDLYHRIENLSRYLAELTLIESDTFLVYLPSQIAASAVYLAMLTLGRTWTRQIADICGYSYDLNELRGCINDLYKTMQQAESHPQQAIREKYKQEKYDYVALTEPVKSLPSFLTQ